MRRANGLAFWTLSIWRTIEAMKKFMFASPHKQVMQKLPYWCDEASLLIGSKAPPNFPPGIKRVKNYAPSVDWRRCSILPSGSKPARS